MTGDRARPPPDPDELLLTNGHLDTPIDLAAVQSDDALLSQLGPAGILPGDDDAELVRVLLAWRREVETEPMGPLVDTDTAQAVITAARQPRPRHPVLGPVAAAGAVLAIAFAGLGLASQRELPGDRLWPLTQVLYRDYADSVRAAITVRAELDTARVALLGGDTTAAGAALDRAGPLLVSVDPAQGHDQLTAEYAALRAGRTDR
jgi:hypothetical protein